MTERGWFDTLGKQVSQRAFDETRNWLAKQGYPPLEVALTLQVVCRDIRHDKPHLAIAYMQTLCDNNMTVAYRALAMLCRTDEDVIEEFKEEIRGP